MPTRHRVAISLSLAAIGLLGSACASSKGSAQQPSLTSLTRVEGRGYPFGSSDAEPWRPLTKTATSRDYGYTEANPIKVGGGSAGERRYLNSLRGPQGQVIQ